MTQARRFAWPHVVPLLPLALCSIVVVDLSQDFSFLGRVAGALLLLLSVAAAVLLLPRRDVSHHRASVILLAGIVLSLGIRTVAQELQLRRTPAEWAKAHDAETHRIAAGVAARFRRLVESAHREGETLANAEPIREAAAHPDAARIANAFQLLQKQSLPHADPAGTPGTSLFDSSFRPLAWAGENHSLDPLFSSGRPSPDPQTVVLVRGTETFLVVLQVVGREEGFLSVEVPLAANRRIENRYLQDFDALSSWAGRSLAARFVSSSGDAQTLGAELAPDGGPRWSGTPESSRLYFGLRSERGKLIGVASIASEQLETSRIELRRHFELTCAVVLTIAAALALGIFLRERPLLLSAVAAVWGFRWVLRRINIPLGMGLDLDNPADYASSLFFGLARSPIDFLLTMTALAVSCLFLVRLLPDEHEPRTVPVLAWVLAPLSALLIFVAANEVVLDAWVNSNLALSDVAIIPGDAPRLTVQLGLLALFVSAAFLGYILFVLAGVERISSRRRPFAFVIDGALLLAAYRGLAPRGYGEHVLLAAIPLVAVHSAALLRSRLRKAFAKRGGQLRWAAGLLFVLMSVVAFYPSVARFESTTIQNFIEGTVTPVVLQHGKSRISVLLDTARAIDRMYRQGELGDLASEDLAYRIWVSTDLSVSTLSSSVEVVDPSRRVVSRFALSFPVIDLEEEKKPAPQEWIPEERRFDADPTHPGFTTARRTFLGPEGSPWEIRIRVAADWHNLPFITSSDPYLQLFRTAAVENPLRFPDQELELTVLTPDGTLVFQSVPGTPQPEPAVLERARQAPLWWQHEHEGQTHRTYLVSDADYVYALSYPEKPFVTCAAEFTRWALLAALVGIFGLASARLFALLSGRALGPADELVSAIRTSFSAKLYVAFVLLALAPILSLAFLIRGIMIGDLERDVEQEGVDRARVSERVVHELHLAAPSSALGTAPVTDSVLEQVAAVAGVDADLYIGGELLATSNPELVSSGLLHTRAAPSAQLDVVVERLSHSIHRESVGSFEYLVVSVPIVLAPWKEPGILSVPLASRQAEIDHKIQSLNQTVLLAALGFSLAAAGLAYSLARRIAGPINELTEATHSVAEGSFDVSLETSSRDEIGALFSSFNQMTADLKQQREDLEKSKKFEAWAEMARQVAHEVKNPLTPIQLATEHLLRVYGDPNVDFEKVLRECSATILQQVKTLRQISMEFSTFASPGPLKLEPTDLSELIQDTLEPYRQNLPGQVRVETDSSGEVPEANVDARLVRRTLVNLVENSLHALNGRGTLRVHLSQVKLAGRTFVEIAVSDNGVGIDPEMKARVFEPYFSTRAAGTGLGLAIARKVVEDHGGTISLESEPGKGTKVTLRFPAVQ